MDEIDKLIIEIEKKKRFMDNMVFACSIGFIVLFGVLAICVSGR